MKEEIKNKAEEDVQSDNSTVASIKADLKAIAAKYNYNAEVKIVSQFGNDQLPMPASVNGTSMVPTLKDGQDIVVLKTTDLKVGDIVVATHPTYGLIVKRLTEINGTQVYLKSDNRKIEVTTTQMNIGNGIIETVTVEKIPLDTWLPIQNVIGVVKVY
jgi:signal peptidase I